jgi:PAS domain S-box-containing protein
MSINWNNHIDRLRSQIAELRNTLRVIKTKAHDERPGLEQTTAQLRELVDKNESQKTLYQFPKILRSILNNPAVGAIILGPNGEHLLFNTAAERLLGADLMADALAEKSGNFGFYMPDKTTKYTKEMLPWQQAVQGRLVPEIDLFVRRQGYVDGLWIKVTSTALKSEANDIGGAVVFLVDITEQVQVETQIQSTCEALEQQMAQIGSAQLELQLLTEKLGKLDYLPAATPNTVPMQADQVVAKETSPQIRSQPNESKSSPVDATADGSTSSLAPDDLASSLVAAQSEQMPAANVDAAPERGEESISDTKVLGSLESQTLDQKTQKVNESIIEQLNAELFAAANEASPETTSNSKPFDAMQEFFEPDVAESQPMVTVAEEPETAEKQPKQAKKPEPKAVELTSTNPKRRKILIVDDIPVNQKLLRLQLKRLGFECEAANNGDAAQKAIANGDFALVLMDLDMPVMDGFESTTAIRKSEQGQGRHIPIVAMTSYDRQEDREKCLAAGMDDFLSKGATQKQLHEVVERCMQPASHDPASEAARAESAHVAEIVAKESGLDIESLQKQFDKEEVQDVSRLFLSAVNTFIDCIQLGIEEKDAGAVTHFAHSVKGPCAALGIDEMTRLTSEIMSDAESGNWTQVRVKYMKLKSSFGEVRDQLRELCTPGYV